MCCAMHVEKYDDEIVLFFIFSFLFYGILNERKQP